MLVSGVVGLTGNRDGPIERERRLVNSRTVNGKERERGVRTNRNVHFARLERRVLCEVAGYIALSCKHALTASSCRLPRSSFLSLSLSLSVSPRTSIAAIDVATILCIVFTDFPRPSFVEIPSCSSLCCLPRVTIIKIQLERSTVVFTSVRIEK